MNTKWRKGQTLGMLSMVIPVALSFGGCGEYGEQPVTTGNFELSRIEESNEGLASRSRAPADPSSIGLQAWKELCEHNEQVSLGEPPFCAMYLFHAYGEPLGQMFQEDLDIEDIEEREEWSAELARKEAEWKRISLVTAVWRDGRVVRSLDLEEGGPPFREGRIEKTQINKLSASLERTNVFADPLARASFTYVDVGYWVIEFNKDTRSLCLESTERHPRPENGNAERVRFCTLWECIDTWLGQLDLEEPEASQEAD